MEKALKPIKELVIWSGFSGSGKGTVLQILLSKHPEYGVVISHTTRKSRNENDNYIFVNRETFITMVDNSEFLEVVEYSGNLYGTSRNEVIRVAENHVPILEIEIQGRSKIIDILQDVKIKQIFIALSPRELYYRLQKRNTETKEQIVNRLMAALNEAKQVSAYDFIVFNDGLPEDTADKIYQFLKDEKTEADQFCYEEFVAEMEQLIKELNFTK